VWLPVHHDQQLPILLDIVKLTTIISCSHECGIELDSTSVRGDAKNEMANHSSFSFHQDQDKRRPVLPNVIISASSLSHSADFTYLRRITTALHLLILLFHTQMLLHEKPPPLLRKLKIRFYCLESSLQIRPAVFRYS
jgi:hypothetical protein